MDSLDHQSGPSTNNSLFHSSTVIMVEQDLTKSVNALSCLSVATGVARSIVSTAVDYNTCLLAFQNLVLRE